MLRVAVPNKGSLADVASQMLLEAGYSGRRDPKQLVHLDAKNEVEFFYLRPRDIATYVGSGALDVGITGRDLLLDAQADAVEIAALNFGDSTFRFAGPPQFRELSDLSGVRVATSYPTLVDSFLRSHNVEAAIVKLDGAVESAVRLGVADAVADVVSTGATLRSAGLEIFGPVILESTAVLISRDDRTEMSTTLLRRLQGTLVARDYVLVDYDLPADKIDQATQIAPGIESPTISQTRESAWVAVRVLVRRAEANDIMDALYDIGARAILVSAIHAARL